MAYSGFLRALACTSRSVYVVLYDILRRLRMRAPDLWNIRQTLLEQKVYVVPVGSDQFTCAGGLFPHMVCCLTAAHCREWSISMLRRLGFSYAETLVLLARWCSRADNILTFKAKRPPVADLRRDARAFVKRMIKTIMAEEVTVVFVMTSWLLDLLAQWRFNVVRMNHSAWQPEDGKNALADAGVACSVVPAGKVSHSRMLSASYLGEHVFELELQSNKVRTHSARCVVMGHGGGSGAGQHAATVHYDALGLARAAVGETMMPKIVIHREDY